MEPLNWNAVVVGRWNTAILAPAGIRTRIYGLDEGTPVEVLVPMDGIGPYRVGYEDCVVVVGSDRVVVEASNATASNLAKAMEYASRSIESLPETPVTAAGYNVRFKLTDNPEALLGLVGTKLDRVLSDAGFKIGEQVTRRAIPHKGGTVNLEITAEPDGEVVVVLNFHHLSTDPSDLRKWLTIDPATLSEEISEFLSPLGQTYAEETT